MVTVQDEILSGEPLYRLLDKDGNIIWDNIRIELITAILQQGTAINKALFDKVNIEIIQQVLGNLVCGVYTGNGNESQNIELGFEPKALLIFPQTGMLSSNSGLALKGHPVTIPNSNYGRADYTSININENGFTVYFFEDDRDADYVHTNVNGKLYHYLAWRGEAI